MLALDRALSQLDKATGFAKAFDELVVRRGGFPHGWLTAEKIHVELTARGFWRGDRGAVHPHARLRLLTRFLDQLVDQPDRRKSDQEWKRFDGQYKRNPQTRLIEYRGAQMGRSFDRRSYLRVAVANMHTQYGPVLNLSDTGLMFSSTEPPKMQVGSRGYLRLTHPPTHTSIRVKAKIVWMSPTAPGGPTSAPSPRGTRIGADFRGLTMQDQAVIAKLLVDAGDPDDETFDSRRSPRL